MQIKDLKINGKTFLAPLAGITNLPFRKIVKQCGCSVVCSEMVSAKGIFHHSQKTLVLMQSTPEEQPLSIQLFGADPESMAKGAQIVHSMKTAAILDLNFGCSVKKIVKQGAGVALMRTPDLAAEILKSVRGETDLPLTIKIRTGWDPSGRQAFEIAQLAQENGVDAIVIHPRTAVQAFRGISDWHLIRRLKTRVDIPVIGNGDIQTPEDALKMIRTTGCDAVMVGRAALKNPFIFSQIDAFLDTGTYQTPSSDQIFDIMRALILAYTNHFGEAVGSKMLRGRLAWFVKGMPGSAAFRKSLSEMKSQAHAMDLIEHFSETLKNRDQGF